VARPTPPRGAPAISIRSSTIDLPGNFTSQNVHQAIDFLRPFLLVGVSAISRRLFFRCICGGGREARRVWAGASSSVMVDSVFDELLKLFHWPDFHPVESWALGSILQKEERGCEVSRRGPKPDTPKL
jgi:hypothetical protein